MKKITDKIQNMHIGPDTLLDSLTESFFELMKEHGIMEFDKNGSSNSEYEAYVALFLTVIENHTLIQLMGLSSYEKGVR